VAGMTDSNIWTMANVDSLTAYNTLLAGELPEEDSFFISSASLKQPRSVETTDKLNHTLEFVTSGPYELFSKWVDKPTMKRGEDYEALKESLAERYLPHVERYVPGIRDNIRTLDVGTPVTNVTYAAAPLGSIYGPEHTPAPWGQPRYALEGPLPGLFLCGSSTLGACIVFASISGFIAASMAMSMVMTRAD